MKFLILPGIANVHTCSQLQGQSITNYHPPSTHPENMGQCPSFKEKMLFIYGLYKCLRLKTLWNTCFGANLEGESSKKRLFPPVILLGSRNSAPTLRNCIYVRDDERRVTSELFGPRFHGRYVHNSNVAYSWWANPGKQLEDCAGRHGVF